MSTPSRLIVKLKVPSEALASLGAASSPGQQRKAARAKATSGSSLRTETKPVDDSAAENASESNATPAPNGDAEGSTAAPAGLLKRKGVPGPKPGHKRMPPAISIDGVPKPRGKPGPKKRKV